MPGIILSVSGGLDSAVMLSHSFKMASHIVAVNFQYGSKHNPYELEAYKKIAAATEGRGVLFLEPIDLTAVFKGCTSSLINPHSEVPKGHYQEPSMKRTVVPGRNLMFISILASLAENYGCSQVWIGAHAGDHFIYPDCRPEFVRAAHDAVHLSSDRTIGVQAPFRHMDKREIVAKGMELGTPFILTRTCYMPQTIACGQCGSCQERLEAFAGNGLVDPIEYMDKTIQPKPKRV